MFSNNDQNANQAKPNRLLLNSCMEHIDNIDMNGSRIQNGTFLVLPAEILWRILLHLPSSTLISCMQVHPLLEDVIRDPHFLDSYTRRVLGISDSNGQDIKFCNLQKASLLMELWYLSYDTHVTFQDGARSFRRRDSLFFTLDCLHHSLITWLAQSAMAGMSLMNCGGYVENNIQGYLSKYVDMVPRFVQEILAKFMFAFPEWIERTLLSTLLSLHSGMPTSLQHVWHDGIPSEIKDKFQTEYCLEVILGETVDSPSYLAAILMCFNRFHGWFVWTGSVTQFPGCRFEKTSSLVSMNLNCSVSEIRVACTCVKKFACERTNTDNNLNSQWKRQILYPGMCYQINQIKKSKILLLIERKIDKDACIPSTISAIETLSVQSKRPESKCRLCTSEYPTHLTIHHPFICNQHYQSFYDTLQNNEDQRSINIPEKPDCREIHSKFSNTFLYKDSLPVHHIPGSNNYLIAHNSSSSLDITGESYIVTCQSHINDSTTRHVLPFELHNVETHNNQVELISAFFQPEILRYVCDPDSHQVLCPNCSKLWFPSTESLTQCISQFSSRGLVPKEYWPYHVLNELLIILTESHDSQAQTH